MKSIKTFFESQIKLSDACQYVKSWVIEREPKEFNNIFRAIVNGLEYGVNDNARYCREEEDKEYIEKSKKIVKELQKYIED